jgi:outer membrane protein assembly factor BamA
MNRSAFTVCSLAMVMWSAGAAAQVANGNAAAADRLSKAIVWTESIIDGAATGRDGFHPSFGDLISGSGPSIGSGYRQHLFGDRALLDVSAEVSTRRYTAAQSTILWPNLAGGRVSLGAQVKYQDFTAINFFGVGPNALEDDQTNYRLRYVDVGGFATLPINRRFTVTAHAGALRGMSLGRGTSTLVPATADRFDDEAAPGLSRQPNYLHADLAIEADSRDVPGYPSRGGHYQFSAAAFHDADFGQYSFGRFEAEAAQYMPISSRSVLSVRGRLAVSTTADGQQVPFYALPSLGNAHSLRGYSSFRFRDRDLVLFNAEYRWPLLRMLDGAVFWDAGSVAPTLAGLAPSSLIADYGAGVRLHSKKHLIVRLDVARGREGMQAIVAFSPVLTFSKPAILPYVP